MRRLPVTYAASGMAAMSAVMLAMRRLWPRCYFDVRAGGYPETAELAAALRAQEGGCRVAVIDSTVDTPATARLRIKDAHAVIFDTSCFAATSGRIRAIVAVMTQNHRPMILVRSHTKLDCLGLEYGRLGSVVVAGGPADERRGLHASIADFVRLTGSGALPMHFPPFAGSAQFNALSSARTAWTIRSCRFLERKLRSKTNLRTFGHGLFFVMFPRRIIAKEEARAVAAELVGEMTRWGIPTRHAGSFGFDFFACDWFEDPASQKMGVRLSIGDLPSAVVRRADDVIANWLTKCQGAAMTTALRKREGGPPLL